MEAEIALGVVERSRSLSGDEARDVVREGRSPEMLLVRERAVVEMGGARGWLRVTFLTAALAALRALSLRCSVSIRSLFV